MANTVCQCGWKVPVRVVIDMDETDGKEPQPRVIRANVLYDCPECGQGRYVPCIDTEEKRVS